MRELQLRDPSIPLIGIQDAVVIVVMPDDNSLVEVEDVATEAYVI